MSIQNTTPKLRPYLARQLSDGEIYIVHWGIPTWLIWRLGGIENRKRRWLCDEHTKQGTRWFILVWASGVKPYVQFLLVLYCLCARAKAKMRWSQEDILGRHI
jgi:hypothetical protein